MSEPTNPAEEQKTPEKETKPEKAPKVEKPKDRTDEILGAIGSLTAAVSRLVESKEIPVTEVKIPQSESRALPPVASVEAVKSKFPVPVDFRDQVDGILNKNFGIEIDYQGDTASFTLNILVPREYSNAGQPHWEYYKEDRRVKVIENALGVNGVREYCELVYKNLPAETQSKIVFDRAQP